MTDSMLAPTLSDDPTVDELRAALAPALARNAAFDGWGPAAIANAAMELGVDADLARLAFADGAADMIDCWFASVDAELERRCPPEMLAAMKIRARIAHLLETRFEIVAPDREAQRRALAILAMPQNAPHAARLMWRAADHMWRLAGDNATDFNHFSKRMTLSAVSGLASKWLSISVLRRTSSSTVSASLGLPFTKSLRSCSWKRSP